MKEMVITSPAFKNGGFIPSRYTCDGANKSPPIAIDGLPEGTQSLVLVMDDPDAPMGTWDHWIVWNIPPTEKIEEDCVPGTECINSFNKHSYGGPCPPSGTHRYFFKIYALDAKLDLKPNARKKDVENALKEHILGKGEIVGLYKRR